MTVAALLQSAEDAIWGFMHRVIHTENGPLGEAFDHSKILGMTQFKERIKPGTGISVNPCVGRMQLAHRITITNDIDPAITATSNIDAREFLRDVPQRKVATVLFDAPRTMDAAEVREIISLSKAVLAPAGVLLSVMTSKVWNEARVSELIPGAGMLVIHQSDGVYIVNTFKKMESVPKSQGVS
jgi:hypothetical protein